MNSLINLYYSGLFRIGLYISHQIAEESRKIIVSLKSFKKETTFG